MIDKTNRETALVYLILFQYITLSGHCTMGLCSSFCTVSIKQGFLGYETWGFFLYPVSLTLSLRRRKSIICQHKSDLKSSCYSLCQNLIGTHTFRILILSEETLGKSQFSYSVFPFFPQGYNPLLYLCVYKYLKNPLLRWETSFKAPLRHGIRRSIVLLTTVARCHQPMGLFYNYCLQSPV